MIPRFEYFPTIQSGTFFELRDSPLYRERARQEISLFCSAEGRFYRDMDMRPLSEPLVVGQVNRAAAGESSVLASVARIIAHAGQREPDGRGCQIVSSQAEVFEDRFLCVSGCAKNTGESTWFGWGVHADFCDAVGVRLFDRQGELHAERRIAIPYECVVSGTDINFHGVFPLRQLVVSPGEYTVEIDLVRDGVAWYSDENGRCRLSLTIEETPAPVELEYQGFPEVAGQLALTFDGGSSATCSAELLQILRQYRVECTMFLTGAFIRRHPELVSAMVQDGHEIANHTLSHPRLCFDQDPQPAPGVDRALLERELTGAARLFHDLTGQRFAPLWRAPFGHRNPLLMLWASELGYQHIFWDFDSEDWRVGVASGPPLTAENVGLRSLEFVRGPQGGRGNILLFHVASGNGKDPFYPWIERLIVDCRERGISLVKVSQLLEARRLLP